MTIIVNDKLAQFLSNVYLGPMFEDGESKEPVQEYLKFLDPKDPFYRVTTKTVLFLLLGLYPIANNIKRTLLNREEGTFAATEIKEIFSYEHAKVLKDCVEHQEKFGEVEGDYQQYKMGSHSGQKTISHGVHLQADENPRAIYQIWQLPREYSNYFIGAIVCNNTKQCIIINDDLAKEQKDLCKKLIHTKGELVKHPEMILNSSVKSASKY